jgi:hypothetical protein
MDITNNVSIPNNEPISNLLNNNINDILSSDYDVSTEVTSLKKKKMTVLNEEDIVNILNGKDISFELENFNINDLNKMNYYNKLDSNQKTLVINRLYEKLPKNQKMPKNLEMTNTKETYFYCKKCGYNEKIPDKMFIFSRTSEKSSENKYSNKFINYKYDNTLPFTKKYNCLNKNCPTHKEPDLKNAVFHRIGGTYAIRYICSVCDTYWSTSVEN